MLHGAPLTALSDLLSDFVTVTSPLAMFAALFCLVAAQVARREGHTFELTDGLLFGVAGGALGAVVRLMWILRAAPASSFANRWPLVAPTLAVGLMIGGIVGSAVVAATIWRENARQPARGVERRSQPR